MTEEGERIPPEGSILLNTDILSDDFDDESDGCLDEIQEQSGPISPAVPSPSQTDPAFSISIEEERPAYEVTKRKGEFASFLKRPTSEKRRSTLETGSVDDSPRKRRHRDPLIDDDPRSERTSTKELDIGETNRESTADVHKKRTKREPLYEERKEKDPLTSLDKKKGSRSSEKNRLEIQEKNTPEKKRKSSDQIKKEPVRSEKNVALMKNEGSRSSEKQRTNTRVLMEEERRGRSAKDDDSDLFPTMNKRTEQRTAITPVKKFDGNKKDARTLNTTSKKTNNTAFNAMPPKEKDDRVRSKNDQNLMDVDRRKKQNDIMGMDK